jgi:hypothetical protein
MIKKVNAESTSFLYVLEYAPNELNNYKIYYPRNIYLKYSAAELTDVRMILDQMPYMKVDNRFDMYYLYWLESKDLLELDQKVLNDAYTDADFENSIKCEYQPAVVCMTCDAVWSALAVDSGLPYIGNKELLRIKIKNLFNKKANLKCPNCNSAFREDLVVKIFGPYVK